MTTESLCWYKSSYSSNGGNCVEIAVGFAATRGVVPVRDSKQVSGPVLRVSADAFSSFVAGVRGGELDAV
ncbi:MULTISPECIES: DUF397 domain-containing protein [unclassified Streptomyces]|uniref:DUF397 domain-containing protein n=1 Tax=unclassified Streptomyces TaxID=2593676 RepID=UPI000CD545D8|nr:MULTISPECIES: DUF397 domain-containing protein [unclassified Streptomyces]AWL38922.1 DUF397 domain-containing protein [Streptomyces sp. SM18]